MPKKIRKVILGATHAATYGRTEEVRRLIADGENAAVKDKAGLTPLHAAARFGHVADSQVLLNAGADVHSKDPYGWTPLHYSAGESHEIGPSHETNAVLAKLQEAARARMNKTHGSDLWLSPAKSAAAARLHVTLGEVAKLLLDSGANVMARTNGGKTPLHYAATLGREVVARVLLDSGGGVAAKDLGG